MTRRLSQFGFSSTSWSFGLALLLPVQVVVMTGTFLGALVVASAAESTDSTSDKGNPCRLWMAPSHTSTASHPKFALFTGVPLEKGDVIPNVDLAIPLVDLLDGPYHQQQATAQQNPNDPDHKAQLDYLEPFLWTSNYVGNGVWAEAYSTATLHPGVGVHAHYHAGLSNVEWSEGSTLLKHPPEATKGASSSSSSVPFLPPAGKPHPSRGAISIHDNVTMVATRAIPAGMELFADNPFNRAYQARKIIEEAPDKVDVFQDILLRKDYEDADDLIAKILTFFNETKASSTKNDADAESLLHDEVLEFMKGHWLDVASGRRAKSIRSLIPDHASKLKDVLAQGGTFAHRNADLQKSEEWFNERGVCVDTMTGGISTIPDAGRGAFATRNLTKGSVIGVVPLLPVLDGDELLTMYAIVDQPGQKTPPSPSDGGSDNAASFKMYDKSKPPIGEQLLLNYAYGHSESSLRLIPTGPFINLVNHRSLGKGANTFLSWSTHAYLINENNFHDMELDDWLLHENPTLTMVLVALEDIPEGEEIFMDYGSDWQASWDAYKARWETSSLGSSRSSAANQWPLRAVDLLPKYHGPYGRAIQPFPVGLVNSVLNKKELPYPSTVATACFVADVTELADGEPRVNDMGLEVYNWGGPYTFDEYKGNTMRICDLLAVQKVPEEEDGADGAFTYTYTIQTRMTSDSDIIEVRGVPHVAITLLEKPHMSDIHTEGAFRHYIAIEDARFPQAWRDLRN